MQDLQGRKKHKEAEHGKEITKKALASFVWPRRAKTPSPDIRRSGSRRRNRPRNSDEDKWEQHKSVSPQMSSQTTLAQLPSEDSRPNWAAAARWLAQAHTHRKAVRGFVCLQMRPCADGLYNTPHTHTRARAHSVDRHKLTRCHYYTCLDLLGMQLDRDGWTKPRRVCTRGWPWLPSTKAAWNC